MLVRGGTLLRAALAGRLVTLALCEEDRMKDLHPAEPAEQMAAYRELHSRSIDDPWS